jgi:hypothetical protein
MFPFQLFIKIFLGREELNSIISARKRQRAQKEKDLLPASKKAKTQQKAGIQSGTTVAARIPSTSKKEAPTWILASVWVPLLFVIFQIALPSDFLQVVQYLPELDKYQVQDEDAEGDAQFGSLKYSWDLLWQFFFQSVQSRFRLRCSPRWKCIVWKRQPSDGDVSGHDEFLSCDDSGKRHFLLRVSLLTEFLTEESGRFRQRQICGWWKWQRPNTESKSWRHSHFRNAEDVSRNSSCHLI